MAFEDWIPNSRRRLTEDGARSALRQATIEFYFGGLRRLVRVWNVAPAIYEGDRDALVLLDGCRADLLDEMADAYATLSTGRNQSNERPQKR